MNLHSCRWFHLRSRRRRCQTIEWRRLARGRWHRLLHRHRHPHIRMCQGLKFQRPKDMHRLVSHWGCRRIRRRPNPTIGWNRQGRRRSSLIFRRCLRPRNQSGQHSMFLPELDTYRGAFQTHYLRIHRHLGPRSGLHRQGKHRHHRSRSSPMCFQPGEWGPIRHRRRCPRIRNGRGLIGQPSKDMRPLHHQSRRYRCQSNVLGRQGRHRFDWSIRPHHRPHNRTCQWLRFQLRQGKHRVGCQMHCLHTRLRLGQAIVWQGLEGHRLRRPTHRRRSPNIRVDFLA